ncbi:sigma-70 family RNA polymerase sigma factor [Ekhidna sp.]|uniref:RNA polymerase sigma factor n=1 Tax=Ekhidna sp. TaxID=2608089 RepID=UPI0032ED590A
MTETQIVWIKQLKKGNELAAFNLYNSYAKAMYSTLTRMTNDNDVAKDLLQEAFVRAFRKIGDLEDPMAFAGWLKRIVVNIGLEYVRKRKIYFEDIQDQQDLKSEELDEKLVDNKTLHNAIKELPDGCRTVLCLHLLEGYKHREIAEQLGITESTSKTQFRHAKQLLKTKLQHHYEY